MSRTRMSVRAVVLNGDKLLALRRNKFGKQYHTLIGGGVDVGEDGETALRRELREETCMEVGTLQLLWVEDAGDPYGKQYIYWCQYLGGEPQLAPDSEEAHISRLGQNTYEPVWLPVADLSQTVFRSESVKQALLAALRDGFPEKPVQLAWKPEVVGQ